MHVGLYAHLQGNELVLGNAAQAAAATHTVASAMQSAGGVMAAVNKTADPVSMQQTMAAFARESEMMDVAGDMMDDALEGNESEDEADDVVNQVRSGPPC